MAIQRMSDQNKIQFLKKEDTSKMEDAQRYAEETEQQRISRISEEQKSKKLDSKDNGLKSAKSIMSARAGEILEMGGPSKYVKSETSNTIWDKDKIEKLSKIVDKEKVNEQQSIQKSIQKTREKEIESAFKELGELGILRASSITPAGGSKVIQEGGFKKNNNIMSIFDKGDFERLPEKTAGEALSEEKRQKEAERDESWRNDGKYLSTKSMVNRMFDNLMSKKED